jgi:chemotaxis protein methyltransferase WspC
MSQSMIAAFLRQRLGMDPRIIGDRKLAKSLENRRIATGAPTLEAYLHLLQTSALEFEAWVEQIVVPETWFFRDRKPFDFLMNRAKELAPSGRSKLRLLSAPCSTGEEPYGMAIALLEAGLSKQHFQIDAIDLSHRAIAKAKRGLYGKNSFRGAEWVDRHRYFEPTPTGWAVSAVVRSTVEFRQANLIHDFESVQGKYDMIFCRNVLIYLDPQACTQILHTLHQMLVPGGLLFVGAAETGKVPSDRFTFLHQAFTFAYQKITVASAPALPGHAPKAAGLSMAVPAAAEKMPRFPSQPPARSALRLRLNSTPPAHVQTPPTPAPPPPKPQPHCSNASLDHAQKLADLGQIEAAINHCLGHLKTDSTSAEAYILLGALYQAQSNYPQAEQSFQRALYLDPKSDHASLQLALLKEHRGDRRGAEVLRRRLQKLQNSS